MHESAYEGIRFVEGRPANAQIIAPIEIQIGGIIESAQLRNLNDVKRLMAERVRAAKGNAVVNFTYGQRSVGFWASILQRDDVRWYGTGFIAQIS